MMAKNIKQGKAWWMDLRTKCENCGTSWDVERSDMTSASDPMSSSIRVVCPECKKAHDVYRPFLKLGQQRKGWSHDGQDS